MRFKDGFADELHRQGYRRSAANRMQLMSPQSRWLEREGLAAGGPHARRRHSALGMLTPTEYEDLHATQQAA